MRHNHLRLVRGSPGSSIKEVDESASIRCFHQAVANLGHRRALLKAALAAMAFGTLSGQCKVVIGQEAALAVAPRTSSAPIAVASLHARTIATAAASTMIRVSRICATDGFCATAIIECLPGSECYKGECCATTCELDDDCTVFDPCRWGRCGVDSHCEFTELDPCVICASDEDCLDSGQNTVCCGGACRRPCPVGTLMGKGCECQAIGSVNLDGVVVHDDASG